MTKQQGKYELLKEETSLRKKHAYIQGCLLLALCAMSSVAVYATWTMIYRQNLIIPPKLFDIPQHWQSRIERYQSALRHYVQQQAATEDVTNSSPPPFGNGDSTDGNDIEGDGQNQRVKELENERVLPSRFGNFIYSKEIADGRTVPKIVCYYTTPSLSSAGSRHDLDPEDIDPHLCTHLHIGAIEIVNNTLMFNSDVRTVFNRTNALKRANPQLKILFWVIGGSIGGFSDMVANHARRKLFIQSLKANLEQFRVDGVDLDWEFPNSGSKRRMHFSQLLHEIRREYQREHRTYILSVTVAAPATIAYMSYDAGEINSYADYVNIMTYDFHFYSPDTPQTGLNAPLYSRQNEHSIFGTLNINSSVQYWLSAGLDRSKLIVGLPTYGHTFQLVNPFNARLGAPAAGYGRVGMLGFATYSEVCWFRRHNIYVHQVYDVESCSPYLYAGTEWISYEDERSLECKTNFIKRNGFGGAMIFSLNTDDFGQYCADNALYRGPGTTSAPPRTFPLLRKVRSVLMDDADPL